MSVNLERLLGKESEKGDVVPSFGISIRAMNGWTKEMIVQRGNIATFTKPFQKYALLREKVGDSWTSSGSSRYYKDQVREEVERLAGEGKYEQIRDLDMAKVENWQNLANITGLPYHLEINSQHDYDEYSDMKNPIYLIFEATIVPQE